MSIGRVSLCVEVLLGSEGHDPRGDNQTSRWNNHRTLRDQKSTPLDAIVDANAISSRTLGPADFRHKKFRDARNVDHLYGTHIAPPPHAREHSTTSVRNLTQDFRLRETFRFCGASCLIPVHACSKNFYTHGINSECVV